MLTTEFVTFQNNPNNGDIMRFLSHIDVSKTVLHASDQIAPLLPQKKKDSPLVDLLYLKRETVVVPALYKYTISEEEEKIRRHELYHQIKYSFQGSDRVTTLLTSYHPSAKSITSILPLLS